MVVDPQRVEARRLGRDGHRPDVGIARRARPCRPPGRWAGRPRCASEPPVCHADARAPYARKDDRNRPVTPARHGRHPVRRRDHVPGLGARTPRRSPSAARSTTGPRTDGPGPRRRRRGRHLVGRRARCRDRAWSTGSPSRRPVATAVAPRPVRPAGHQLGRQRGRLRPGGVRLGRRRASPCRAGTTWSSTSSTSAPSRPAQDRRGDFDRAVAAPALPARPGHQRRPGHAAVRVRRRHLVGLQPGPPVRHRVGLRRAGRLQALHPGGPRARHRGHRRRRLQPPRPVRPGPVAVRRLERGRGRRHLLLPGRAGDDARGATPGPTTAAARCARSCATAR